MTTARASIEPSIPTVSLAVLASLGLASLILIVGPPELATMAAAAGAVCVAGCSGVVRPNASGPWLLGFATSLGATVPFVVWISQAVGTDIQPSALIVGVLVWSALFLGVAWSLSVGAVSLVRKFRAAITQ